MTTVFIGRRLYDWDGPGKAGVVTNVHFIRCFWPRLTEPTRIFAEGSGGIIVQGPPTPRNVVFPDDTVFPDVVADAESAAWEAFKASASGRGYVSPNPAQVQAYLQTYESERKKSPLTATKTRCRSDCCFLVHDVLGTKERYVAEVSLREARDYCDGTITREELNADRDYCRVADNPQSTGTTLYRVEGGIIRNKTTADRVR